MVILKHGAPSSTNHNSKQGLPRSCRFYYGRKKYLLELTTRYKRTDGQIGKMHEGQNFKCSGRNDFDKQKRQSSQLNGRLDEEAPSTKVVRIFFFSSEQVAQKTLLDTNAKLCFAFICDTSAQG